MRNVKTWLCDVFNKNIEFFLFYIGLLGGNFSMEEGKRCKKIWLTRWLEVLGVTEE
jgi:hypothetical protein